jgi:preprotein translocase SecE subunit
MNIASNFIVFLKDAWAELKQVSWLTFPQMVASTWVVVLLVIVMAAYIFFVDTVLKFIFGWIV